MSTEPETQIRPICGVQWPNLGPAGGLWTCTLDADHDGNHEAHGPAGLCADRSAVIPQGHEAILGATPDPFGGHEFHYEGHTDLFSCIRCHRYEVSVRKGDGPGEFEPCTGEPPAGSQIEVNIF